MKKILLFVPFLILLASGACSKSKSGGGSTPTPTPTPITPLITLAPGWKYSATLSLNFPSGIQAFTFDTIFNGRTVKAFCVALDYSSGRFEFKPV